MRVRVHAITTRYPHQGAYSGIRQFLSHLDPTEYQVRTHTSSDGDDDFPLRSPRLRQVLKRLTGRMPWYRLSDLTAELGALALCLGRRVDVVHFLDAEHSVQYLPFFRGYARTRLIGTFHQPSDILAGLVRPEVVRRLDHVTVVAPEQVRFFSNLLPPDRISLLLHGVDTEFFRPGADPRGPAPFECITVGHWLRDYDAVRRLIEKLSQRRGISFRVVSPRANGLEELPNTTVCSGVTDEELRGLYRRADVLLLPLTHATANNALLEAIACGLPVISTSLESVRAYLPGEEAILVERNDPDLLAEAVMRVYRDPELRTRMGTAARRRAMQLGWPRVALKYGALYRRLARPPSPEARTASAQEDVDL